jgi:hypothetical protein
VGDRPAHKIGTQDPAWLPLPSQSRNRTT